MPEGMTGDKLVQHLRDTEENPDQHQPTNDETAEFPPFPQPQTSKEQQKTDK